jgi:archaeal preflagellin peptidase FlaK
MINLFFIFISLTGLFIATYTDLKSRIVPNFLNFGLLFIGIFSSLIFSILFDFSYLFNSVSGAIIGFVFGWVLWKLGVFAGGDVKLFMALGSLNFFTPGLFFSSLPYPLFVFSLFVYSLVAFLPYGLLMGFYKLKTNLSVRKIILSKLKTELKQSVFLSFVVSSLSCIFLFFYFDALLIFVLVTLILFLNFFVFIEYLVYSLIIFSVFFTFIRVLFSLGQLMTQKVSITSLEEGMIPAKTLIFKNKKVVEQDFSFKSILSLAKEGKLNNNEVIVSSRKACGLDLDEIKELKRLYKKGLISKDFYIKDSMPFVPTMLFGYIFCLILGDYLWVLIGLM